MTSENNGDMMWRCEDVRNFGVNEGERRECVGLIYGKLINLIFTRMVWATLLRSCRCTGHFNINHRLVGGPKVPRPQERDKGKRYLSLVELQIETSHIHTWRELIRETF